MKRPRRSALPPRPVEKPQVDAELAADITLINAELDKPVTVPVAVAIVERLTRMGWSFEKKW